MPVSIEIFGVQGYVYDVIRSLLQTSLDSAGVDYTIYDVQQIDEFIAEGLEGVPTIRIDYKKCFTKTPDISPEEIVRSVSEYVQAHLIQYVVCPIDFSEHSIHAAKWASHLARLLKMRVKLIHIFKPAVESSYTLSANVGETVTALKGKMDDISHQINPEESTAPTTSVDIGDPLQTIVRISKEPSTGMIVMGTLGSSELTRRLFGSISSTVARHAYAPVLLVPPQISFEKPKRIMVAFHEELVTNGVINELMNINRQIHAHIQFVHVQEDDENYHEIRDRLLNKLTSPVLPDFSFDVQEIRSDNKPVLYTLMAYAEETNPDIIVFVTRHRNLVRRLLYPGLTQQMSTHLKWPLLVMRNG